MLTYKNCQQIVPQYVAVSLVSTCERNAMIVYISIELFIERTSISLLMLLMLRSLLRHWQRGTTEDESATGRLRLRLHGLLRLHTSLQRTCIGPHRISLSVNRVTRLICFGVSLCPCYIRMHCRGHDSVTDTCSMV